MWEYKHTDELMHYGILGMKWGVRRYRKRDGSLTPLGKKRLRKANQETEDNASDDYKKARSKSTKEMSDAELSSAIRRLQMEKQYRDLNPAPVSRGKKIADKILKTAGDVALETGKQIAKDYVSKKAKDKLGLSDGKSDYDKQFDAITKINKMESAKKMYKTNTGQDWSWSSKKK